MDRIHAVLPGTTGTAHMEIDAFLAFALGFDEAGLKPVATEGTPQSGVQPLAIVRLFRCRSIGSYLLVEGTMQYLE